MDDVRVQAFQEKIDVCESISMTEMEYHIRQHPIDELMLDVMIDACRVAFHMGAVAALETLWEMDNGESDL